MPEVVCEFCCTDSRHELANCPVETSNSSLGSFAQMGLEFAIGQLDRIEIRRILRQVTYRCSRFLNCLLDARDLVGSKVVHDDNVVAAQCWDQALLNIGQ